MTTTTSRDEQIAAEMLGRLRDAAPQPLRDYIDALRSDPAFSTDFFTLHAHTPGYLDTWREAHRSEFDERYLNALTDPQLYEYNCGSAMATTGAWAFSGQARMITHIRRLADALVSVHRWPDHAPFRADLAEVVVAMPHYMRVTTIPVDLFDYRPWHEIVQDYVEGKVTTEEDLPL